jgi:hypothetical protein
MDRDTPCVGASTNIHPCYSLYSTRDKQRQTWLAAQDGDLIGLLLILANQKKLFRGEGGEDLLKIVQKY